MIISFDIPFKGEKGCAIKEAVANKKGIDSTIKYVVQSYPFDACDRTRTRQNKRH